MSAYGQFCPVAKTAEIFAERWTPLIIRELCVGPALFNDLRRRLPLISKTLLAQRLRELERAGIVSVVEKTSGPGYIYSLTEAGRDLRPLIEMMGLWGQRHLRNILSPDDLDPVFLLMSMRGQVPASRCPAGRFVICFEFRNIPNAKAASRRWWFVVTRPEIDLCMKDPGHPIDVTVAADLGVFTRVWMGYLGLGDDQARAHLAYSGSEAAIGLVNTLLGLSHQPHERPFVFDGPEIVDAVLSKKLPDESLHPPG